MTQPKIALACVSNVFIRQMSFEKAGDTEQGHSHPFDHTSFLSRGSIEITVEGETRQFTAPQLICIRKNKEHMLVALEDNTEVSCIHALRDGPDVGDIISPDAIISHKEREQMVMAVRHWAPADKT